MKRILQISLVFGVLLTLSGCGFDPNACFRAAKEYVEADGGELHGIPGKDYDFIATYPDEKGKAAFVQTLNAHNCEVTTYHVFD